MRWLDDKGHPIVNTRYGLIWRRRENDKASFVDRHVQFLPYGFQPQPGEAKQFVARPGEPYGRHVFSPFVKAVGWHKATLMQILAERAFLLHRLALRVNQKLIAPCQFPAPRHFHRLKSVVFLDDDGNFLRRRDVVTRDDAKNNFQFADADFDFVFGNGETRTHLRLIFEAADGRGQARLRLKFAEMVGIPAPPEIKWIVSHAQTLTARMDNSCPTFDYLRFV